MSLNSGETLQPFKPLNQLIYDSAGNLIGIQNDRANGSDLRIGGGSGVDGTFATLVATTALKINSGGTFDLYNTADQTTNYERLAFAWGSNIATISTDAAGTGTVRVLRINGSTLSLMSGGTQRWNVNGSGHFLAEADNTYDIGASGANRPKNLYVGSGIVAGGVISTTNYISSLYSVITDGATAPGATVGVAKIYVDSADGDLKIIFGDGTIKTIVTDT